jgi:hypothetical protein
MRLTPTVLSALIVAGLLASPVRAEEPVAATSSHGRSSKIVR